MPNAEGRIPALMLQGTGTDVGKSLLVAGLGRAFTKRGLSVRPFKPQNMSNNAAVTADGGEIGRAQALQARACGVAPSVHMNPVLLKPQSDIGSQVVVQGKMLTNAKAQDYYQLKSSLLPRVLDSFSSVAEGADLVLIEGAGSAAEVNLRASDIANMGFAEAADVPVLLVGDIDKGGVIASVVGTHALISDAERRRVCGYLINKFRGDKALFEPAIEIIQARTGWPCLGVVRWFEAAGRLPAEDAMALARPIQPAHDTDAPIKIAVPQFARIANFDDLDPLIAEPDVEVRIVPAETALPGDADLVVLAGSKATLSDLAHFRAQGWDVDLAGHVRRGGRVLGLCGGYQMLGRRVADPEGIEGPPGEAEGLGYLDVETTLAPAKTLRETHGTEQSTGTQVRGYEMHIGVTTGPDCARPMLTLSQDGAARPDGAVSADGRIAGCYLHGLFAEDGFRAAYLAALSGTARSAETAYNADVEATLDGLADHLAQDIDLDALLSLARR